MPADRRRSPWLISSALCAAFAIGALNSGCEGPGHVYQPPGQGRIVYDPERGLIRQAGPLPDVPQDAEELFRAGMKRFNQGDYEGARKRLRLYRQRLYPDGPRALEAVIWESIALIERERDQATSFLIDHIANAYHDKDREAYAAVGIDPDQLGAERDLLDLARVVAEDFSRSDLQTAWELSQEIFVYYSAGLAVQTIPGGGIRADDLPDYRGLAADRSFFTMHARHARNLAWFALLAEQPRVAREVSSFVEKRTQSGAVRNPSLLILAEASLQLDAPVFAERAYHDLAEANGVSPRVQEQALYGEVRAIIAQSKGVRYDAEIFERADAKIDNYKAGFYANHPSGARLVEAFYEARRDLLAIQITKLDEAARTYERLFEEEAAIFYQRRANEARARYEKLTLASFRELPGIDQLGGGQ